MSRSHQLEPLFCWFLVIWITKSTTGRISIRNNESKGTTTDIKTRTYYKTFWISAFNWKIQSSPVPRMEYPVPEWGIRHGCGSWSGRIPCFCLDPDPNPISNFSGSGSRSSFQNRLPSFMNGVSSFTTTFFYLGRQRVEKNILLVLLL